MGHFSHLDLNSPGNLIPIFVSLPRNLEDLFLEEMREFGIKGFQKRHLGAEAKLNLGDIYALVYSSRLASRVLSPIAELKQLKSTQDLYDQTMDFPWEKLIANDQTFVIQCTVRDSVMTHSHYAAQLFKDAICDRCRQRTGLRPSVEKESPDIALDLRIRGEQATISIHYSSVAQFRRQYRTHSVTAPLKENLAHAVLRQGGWRPGQSLVDLCTGSGTLLIEAAMWATETPAGYYKSKQGFEALPNFDAELWPKIKNRLDRKIVPLLPGVFKGYDTDISALQAARANLVKAGFVEQIKLVNKSCVEAKLADVDWVVANLPYGERLSEEHALMPMYRALGDHLYHEMPNKKAILLASNPNLEVELNLHAVQRIMIDNGDIDVALSTYQC